MVILGKKMRAQLIELTRNILVFSIILLVTGCSILPTINQSIPPTIGSMTVTPTSFQPEAKKLFLSPGIPEEWRQKVINSGEIEITTKLEPGNVRLSQSHPANGESVFAEFSLIYAVVVPFPTVDDDISMKEIQDLWEGNPQGDYNELLIDGKTANVFTEYFGKALSASVSVLDELQIQGRAWESTSAIAIIPFEELNPRWKVLKIDGISPLDKPMDVSSYPLTITYFLVGLSEDATMLEPAIEKVRALLPATNREESKMTVVVTSGTTALVRTTAYKIENHGINYPISEVKEWFTKADIRHVSNEISFSEDCPDPDPWTTSLRFCSREKYLPVLQNLGINVVELTGNHLNDYGPEKLVETIGIYAKNKMDYYGGGLNLLDAKKPLKLESNGNKIAFIGCNYVGPKTDFATDTLAGTAPCDLPWLYDQIQSLKTEGYVVITTYQHNEVYVYMYDEVYQTAFVEAAEAGADFIQGSQAHFPMGFEFSGNSLIHYGLGNFLFDQMDYPVDGTRREFIDRHVIYDGKYINTELLTALLTDWSKPVPMTGEERIQFLSDIFKASKLR